VDLRHGPVRQSVIGAHVSSCSNSANFFWNFSNSGR
jgi:hypothetical protein